jgi:photosystem II stability/assembly factor-like uncharacterized protein
MSNARIGTVLMLLAASCLAVDEPETATTLDTAELTGPPGSWMTRPVERESFWKYYDLTTPPPAGWQTTASEGWPECRGPAGYGESYLNCVIQFGPDANNKPAAAYFRSAPFGNGTNVRKMYLKVMADDGFVFYINGREGGRAQMPSGAVTFTTLATSHEAGNTYTVYDISSQIPNLVGSGPNYLAFEVHQASRSSSDLVFDAELIFWNGSTFESVASGGVPRNSIWREWDRGGDLGTAWRALAFDHSGWSMGEGPLGFGEKYIVTDVSPGPVTHYFRTRFDIDGPVTGLTAEVMFDDGFVAYLNGQEIARAFMPSGAVNASTLALGHEASGYQTFDWSAAAPLLVDGENVLAVEVHQSAASSSDLVFDLMLRPKGGWERLTPITAEDLLDVWFVDAQRGWAVGNRGNIFRTTDGGDRWELQVSGTDEDLVEIQFVDAQHGFIVGREGGVLETTDGGATWDFGFFTTEFTGLSFISGRDGWISTNGPDVFRISDSGEGGIQANPQTVHPQGSWSDVGFWDLQTGWVLGAIPSPDGSDRHAAIFGTDDGGATWTQQWTSGVHHYYLNDIDVVAADPNVAWVVGQGSLSGVSEKKLVSRDGGATWEEKPATENNDGLMAVDFVDRQHGWAVGVHGSIIATSDSGQEWTIQEVGEGEKPWLFGVHFVDRQNGWAVGAAGTVMRTRSGGR